MKIYCKIEDVSMDPEGNIVLFFSKEKETTREVTVSLLKNWIGQEVIITISPLIRRHGQVMEGIEDEGV